jgi:hypothetical protein
MLRATRAALPASSGSIRILPPDSRCPIRYFFQMPFRYIVLGLALAVSGCDLLSGKCTYEIRSLEVAGTINDNGTPFATASMSFSENRGSISNQSVYWLVNGDALKGHVTSASFKNSTDPSKVLLTLDIASPDRVEISQGATGTAQGANLGGFHDILAAGHGIIELATDLPGQLTVQIPLAVTNSTDWTRPYCS